MSIASQLRDSVTPALSRSHTVPKLTLYGHTNMSLWQFLQEFCWHAKDFTKLMLMHEKHNWVSYDGLRCPHKWPNVFTMLLPWFYNHFRTSEFEDVLNCVFTGHQFRDSVTPFLAWTPTSAGAVGALTRLVTSVCALQLSVTLLAELHARGRVRTTAELGRGARVYTGDRGRAALGQFSVSTRWKHIIYRSIYPFDSSFWSNIVMIVGYD